jgi:proteasome lid subunit RPN8/RPN11
LVVESLFSQQTSRCWSRINRRCNSVGCMNAGTVVHTSEDLLLAILEGARRLHPKEIILLLRGKRTKGTIVVSDLVIPPLATHGQGFAAMPTHMLPIDFSIVGTLHSHPSGSVTPSAADLNHQFGRILMIVAYPYRDENNLAVYNRTGERLTLEIARSKV